MPSQTEKREAIFTDVPVTVLKSALRNGKRENIIRLNDVFFPTRRAILRSSERFLENKQTFTPYHCHEGIELLYFYSGEAHVLINNCLYPAKEGDVFIVNSFEPHGIYYSDPTASFLRACIMFHPQYLFPADGGDYTFFKNLKSLFFQNHIPANHPASPAVRSCVEEILHICEAQKEGWTVAIFSKVIEFYATVLQNGLSGIPSTQGAYMFEFMNRVSSYIDQNLDQDISTAEIANACQYSTEHFCRLFKRCFGKTFKDYINVYRIQRAQDFIARGKYTTLAEVSSRYGFNNQNHFSHMFKKYTGMLPSEYVSVIKNLS